MNRALERLTNREITIPLAKVKTVLGRIQCLECIYNVKTKECIIIKYTIAFEVYISYEPNL